MGSSGTQNSNDGEYPRVLEDQVSARKIRRLKRRLSHLRKAGMLDARDPNIRIERAISIETLREAYSLVHAAYIDKGYIHQRYGQVRVRVFEAMPEMATFTAYIDGQLAAVTSVITDSPDLGLPSDHIFAEEIKRLRNEPGNVCEITNLAVADAYRKSPVFLCLTQACFAHARANGCGNMFITVSPGHARFFNEILQFEYWGGRTNCSDEVEDIVEGMRLCINGAENLANEFDRLVGPDDAFLYDFFFTGNSYHRQVADWTHLAEETFTDPMKLRELFIHCSDLLLDCSEEEFDIIERRWGKNILWHAWGEPLIPVS